mgnify:CR=1 FL=1
MRLFAVQYLSLVILFTAGCASSSTARKSSSASSSLAPRSSDPVAAGQEVSAGQPVLVMEAMKMQHTVSAPTDGVVTEINVEPGAQVAAGEVLAVVEEKE